jgi:hypothetical protein
LCAPNDLPDLNHKSFWHHSHVNFLRSIFSMLIFISRKIESNWLT